jgi:hypothetical protein
MKIGISNEVPQEFKRGDKHLEKVLSAAKLSVEVLNKPEAEKGEVNPFLSKDEKQKHNPFVKSAVLDVPEELLPKLLEFLDENGVFTGHVKGLFNQQ